MMYSIFLHCKRKEDGKEKRRKKRISIQAVDFWHRAEKKKGVDASTKRRERINHKQIQEKRSWNQ